MTHQCAACGTTFNDADICPNCQLPVKPPELSTSQPTASPMPVASAANANSASAEEPSAGGKGVRPKKLRLPLVIGIGVASLALVAGVAFAGVKLLSPGGALGGPVQLVVTGEPATPDRWAHGASETWRVAPNRFVSDERADEFGFPVAYGGRIEKVVAFTSDTSTASGTVLGFDASTGKYQWQVFTQEQCSGVLADGYLHCQGGRMGYYPTDFVDLARGIDTGLIPSSQELGTGIPDGTEDYHSWSTTVIGGQLFATWADLDSSNAETKGNLARFSDDKKKLVWKASVPVPGAGTSDPDYPVRDGRGRLNHGVVADQLMAVDADTGKVVVGPSGGKSFHTVEWVADDVLQGGDDKTPTEPFTAADGTQIGRIRSGAISVTSTELPKHPLRQTANGVAAFDPLDAASIQGGKNLWEAKLGGASQSSTQSGEAGSYLIAYRHGLIAIAQQPGSAKSGLVSLIQEDTGKVMWTTSVPVASNADGGVLAPVFAHDGSLLIQTSASRSISLDQGGAELVMLSVADGAMLWSRSGVLAESLQDLAATPFAPGTEKYDGIVMSNLDDTFSRLDPADRPTKAPVVPTSAPACPDGMTAVSWTQYSDGGILLCHADKKYAVVYPSHPDWQAAQLNFTGGGHEVVFSNGARVRVSLGGSVVYTDADGKTTTQTATEAWNNATGEVKVSVPKDLKTCPANSWPISLSTYNGGWLLVCGTTADAPTSMVYNDGSRTSELGSVSYRNGGYCGTGDVGTVCGYRAPAVVSVTDASGKVTQHSVGGNYFDDHGAGGAGQGTGSYGVEAPTDTAKDQVRYLTQILQKSAAGRANLNAAVAQVRSCSDVAGAIATINGVIANRQELLDALASTPVDAVPNGSELVAKLRNALDLSLKSDQVWLQWAQAEQSNSCAEGENSATYKQVETMNRSVATAKDAFVAAWNSQIAGTYKAPRFATSQI